ncbi:hypothetical protein FPV67DRAFT_1654673, partial [Lyophyllum atratum]
MYMRESTKPSLVILIPKFVTSASLLLKDTLSPTQLDSLNRIASRSYQYNVSGLTGANTLDVARVGMDQALITGDTDLLADAYRRSHEELAIMNGVKADGIRGAFGFHDGIPYNGNYGKDYSNTILGAKIEAAGSPFAASATSRAAFETLFEGNSWMIIRNTITGLIHSGYCQPSRRTVEPLILQLHDSCLRIINECLSKNSLCRGVNPIYYETIKLLYTFPQSVGIAGGRPSSSYYFVGSQADNLFYLDPHHARPAVPLRPAPQVPARQGYRETTPESDRDRHRPPPTSPSSVRTGSSTFSYHAPLSPSPLQKEFSTGSESEGSGLGSNNHGPIHSHSPSPSDPLDLRDLTYPSHPSSSGLDSLQEHYVTAYSPAELKTFHCERVRKMPLSGLDPSMLIGFLCKDEADWVDLRKRVAGLPRVVFSVQDEPPVWGGGGGGGDWDGEEGESVGLESISEPDDLDMDFGVEEGEGVGVEEDEDGGDEEDGEGEEDGEEFYDTRSVSTSSASASGSGSRSGGKGRRGRSEEVDTEEDPVDPITPLPNARFSIDTPASHGKKVEEQDGREMFEEGDIEDDWVDPSIPTPTPGGPYAPARAPSPPAATEVRGSNGKAKTGRSRKGRKGEVPVPVPLVKIPTPPHTRQHHHHQQQQQQQQEHFPFPVSQRSADETSPREGFPALGSAGSMVGETAVNGVTKKGQGDAGEQSLGRAINGMPVELIVRAGEDGR